jgi:hypothetical protein
MFTPFSRIFVYHLFVSVPITNSSKPNSILRIHSTLVEILQITLLGNDLNIISHVITEKKNTLNEPQVYIHSPISIDKTSVMFVKVLHSTVLSYDGFCVEEPSNSKFYADFTLRWFLWVQRDPQRCFLLFSTSRSILFGAISPLIVSLLTMHKSHINFHE